MGKDWLGSFLCNRGIHDMEPVRCPHGSDFTLHSMFPEGVLVTAKGNLDLFKCKRCGHLEHGIRAELKHEHGY